MRNLIFIPLLHNEADYGSLSKEMVDKYKRTFGEEKWNKRQKVFSSLWEKISEYFADKDVSGLKIYQDGMVVGGELGEKIVWAVAKMESPNYKLIKNLIQRGANIEKTEDLALVKKERDLILKMVKPKSPLIRLVNRLRYKLIKNTLLSNRDKFIANQINHTLKEGEKGVLFLGALHDVLSKLATDIVVEKLLNEEEVLAL